MRCNEKIWQHEGRNKNMSKLIYTLFCISKDTRIPKTSETVDENRRWEKRQRCERVKYRLQKSYLLLTRFDVYQGYLATPHHNLTHSSMSLAIVCLKQLHPSIHISIYFRRNGYASSECTKIKREGHQNRCNRFKQPVYLCWNRGNR